jgi:hypothetical protein
MFLSVKVRFFLIDPKLTHVFQCEHRRRHLIYIVCEMKVKETTNGLNTLVAH